MATPLDAAAAAATIGAFSLQSLTLSLVFKSKVKKNRALLLESRDILNYSCRELFKYRFIIDKRQLDALLEEYAGVSRDVDEALQQQPPTSRISFQFVVNYRAQRKQCKVTRAITDRFKDKVKHASHTAMQVQISRVGNNSDIGSNQNPSTVSYLNQPLSSSPARLNSGLPFASSTSESLDILHLYSLSPSPPPVLEDPNPFSGDHSQT